MKLLLVRHGETEGNLRGALDTALPGPPLTDLGREQAEALPARLAGEPVVAVYASQAIRAQQTAAPLAAALGLEVSVVDGVQEIGAGDLEGLNDRDSIMTYMGVVRAWTKGDLAAGMPGGETGHQVRTRLLDAVAELRAKHEQADPDGTVVLVGHGGAIRVGSEWLDPSVPAEVVNRELIPNTGVVELVPVADGWQCVSWAGHPF